MTTQRNTLGAATLATAGEFPRICSEAQLEGLGDQLGVPREAGELLDVYRSRVVEAVEASAPSLGGMKLG